MDLSQRLDEMELAIHKPSFRKGTGRANEVNYWVFDYPPEKELEVRERVEYLKNKNDRGDDDFELVVFDLYDIIIDFLEKKNFMEMITQQAWMFLTSFDALRIKQLSNVTISSMAHLGTKAFEEIGGEVVQTTSFVLQNCQLDGYLGTYCRLTDGNSQTEKEKIFLSATEQFVQKQNKFFEIPGTPIAYWVSNSIYDAFESGIPLKNFADLRQGMSTANNDLFLRLWFEVSEDNISYHSETTQQAIESKKKWFPHTKGGGARKWYGNNDYIVNWYNDGEEIRNYPGSAPRSTQYYFREGLSWSTLSSDSISFRYEPKGFTMNTKGSICYLKRADLQNYICGLLNSKPTMRFLELLAPTLDYSQGPVGKVPVLLDAENREKVELCTLENIRLSKEDWDSFETSWNFIIHPLVSMSKGLWDATATAATMDYYYGYLPETSCPLEICYLLWQGQCKERFEKLKANEEELNRIFIDIYGLQDELTPEVEDKDVTVRKADLQRDIKSLLSYAVGCMFGRYSLDVEGLAYAGGKWDSSKYQSYIPDADNVIPITDEEYLDDDIVSRLCAWLKAVYGAETLEANLDYIAKALGNKGSTSREIIRNYFLNDFFKDHCQTYSVTGSGKRPIYWLFDSGKQNGFKALVYLHRYTPDTIGNLRIDYLHKMQRVYESEINRMQDMMDHSGNAREVAAASKRKDKLAKQLKECREYDEKISHLALSRIELDLDDGVKVNYRKLQTAQDGKFYEVLADSKNIMVKEKK